jgi:predicted nucleic-acid-binding protein
MGRENPVKITPDTNVLIRAAVTVRDAKSNDGIQAEQARSVLRDAELIAITAPALCEFVWVLRSVYKYSKTEIEQAIRTLSAVASVICDRQLVEAGLRVLGQGGDFADGVIAFAGAAMGGDTFVSFDRQALRIVQKAGQEVRQAD